MTAGSSAASSRARSLTLAFIAITAAVVVLLAVGSDVTVPRTLDDLRELFAAITPHRTAWYALPVVAALYVVL
jgi:hypothetical protein